MKKLFSFLLSAVTLISLTYQQHIYAEYVHTTIEVAGRIGYPQFIYGLRARIQDFLNTTLVEMKLDVQDLRSAHYNYKADDLTDRYTQRYDRLEARFDKIFEQLDRKLIKGADQLDLEEASVKTKTQFLESLKKEASERIENFLSSKCAQIMHYDR